MVDRRFFPESLERTQQLTNLAAELPTLGSLPEMGRHLVDEIVRVFGVSNATLLVADPDSGVLVSLASSSVDLDHRFGYGGAGHLHRRGGCDSSKRCCRWNPRSDLEQLVDLVCNPPAL